ncbi:hypothetical protein [Methylobacterium soli]|uniref:Uncharacterized protein n=1 Tax=Methylobacterium soli TaxID=553447 RepID=A0A6L3SRH0_9HYPH|nr:hypothetical protein [Methylobacterium soli]KAB1069500.1 hypothetical protein F6X53_30955 [Methylobacterium soli]
MRDDMAIPPVAERPKIFELPLGLQGAEAIGRNLTLGTDSRGPFRVVLCPSRTAGSAGHAGATPIFSIWSRQFSDLWSIGLAATDLWPLNAAGLHACSGSKIVPKPDSERSLAARMRSRGSNDRRHEASRDHQRQT